MKIMHMRKKKPTHNKTLFIPLSLFLAPISPEELPGQSFRYKITMSKMNFKGLLPFSLKPVVKSLVLKLVFHVFK